MRFVRLLWGLGALLLWAAMPTMPTASAQGRAQAEDVDPEARQRFDLATTLYGQGRFVEAAQEFERVYELTDNAILLHNIYVAYRDAGDARKAAEFLRRYLEEAEEIPDRAVMEGRLRTLERQVAEQEQQQQQLEEADAAVEERDEGSVQPAAGAPVTRTAEGPSLTGPIVVMSAGGALLLAGGVVGLLAMQQYGNLEDDCGLGLACPSSKRDEVDQLGTMTVVADVLLGAGVLTAAAGLVWLLVLPDETAEASAELGLACDGRGCLASYRGELP